MSKLTSVDISTQIFNKLSEKSFNSAELAVAAVVEAATKVQGLKLELEEISACVRSSSLEDRYTRKIIDAAVSIGANRGSFTVSDGKTTDVVSLIWNNTKVKVGNREVTRNELIRGIIQEFISTNKIKTLMAELANSKVGLSIVVNTEGKATIVNNNKFISLRDILVVYQTGASISLFDALDNRIAELVVEGKVDEALNLQKKKKELMQPTAQEMVM